LAKKADFYKFFFYIYLSLKNSYQKKNNKTQKNRNIMGISRISAPSSSPFMVMMGTMVMMVMMVMASGLRDSNLSLMMTVTIMVMMRQLFADGRV